MSGVGVVPSPYPLPEGEGKRNRIDASPYPLPEGEGKRNRIDASPCPLPEGEGNPHWESGAALLFTLGTMTLLLSLGSAFVVNMMTENRQTENLVRSLQARLAAQAGLERAVAELRFAAETSFAASSNQPWHYNSASQPSNWRSGSTDSGLLGSSPLLGSTTRYTLRITDTASQIYLNDGNANLASMLEGLPG